MNDLIQQDCEIEVKVGYEFNVHAILIAYTKNRDSDGFQKQTYAQDIRLIRKFKYI